MLETALRWLRDCVDNGHGGKVLLVGFRAGLSEAAWAAGLSEQDYANFTLFGRFVLQKQACDGYWLMLPGEVHGTRGYRCLLANVTPKRGLLAWQQATGWDCAYAEAESEIPDLLAPNPSLPGLQRRQMNALAEQLSIAPPQLPA